MDIPILVGIAFALTILLSAFVQNAMGFGYALVALGLLSFFLGAYDANLIVSLSAFVPITYAAWMNRQSLDRKLFVVSVLAAAIFLPIGLYVFKSISTSWLMRGTGIVIFILAVQGLMKKTKPASESETESKLSGNRIWAFIAGSFSGFMSGAISIGGPPIIIFAARQNWSANQFKSFVTLFLLMITTFKGIGIVAADLLTPKVLTYAFLSIPFAYFGGWLGDRATKHIDTIKFRKIALMLLIGMSLIMILQSSS